MRVIYRIGDPRQPRRKTCVPYLIGRGWFNRGTSQEGILVGHEPGDFVPQPHYYGDGCADHPAKLVGTPVPEGMYLQEQQQAHSAEYDRLKAKFDRLKEEEQATMGEILISTTRDLAEEILQIHAGLDVTSDHGRETPKRFVGMLDELTGCKDCPGECMKWKVFEEEVDQMIVINRIPFASVCNHHVVPFVGHAWIGYVPDKHIAGLSKFARVVHHFARRLQVQERLTEEVAVFLEEQLHPKGVIVVMEAEHLCMTIRGVQTPGTITRTVETRGVFADHTRTAKAEFLTGIK